ncbi:MAG: PAS domain-containing protein, partial [Phormidesmis sp.]
HATARSPPPYIPKLPHALRFEDAATLLHDKPYALFLLYLHLPDGEGLELIKQLKQKAPETPVVVLTGLQDETVAVAALEEGAQDYVLKSDTFSPARLAQIGPTDMGNWLVRRIQYAIKRAEIEKKREIEQARYSLAHQGTNEVIWDWDLKNDHIYLSSRWNALLGLGNSAASSDPNEWLARIHPEDRTRFEQTLQHYLEQRHQKFYCEYRLRHANGDYIWVLAKGKALWDEAGIAYRMVGSQADITFRKSQEAEAYQKRELAQTVMHTVGAGLLSVQARLFINEGLYEEAEPLLECALAVRKSLLGNRHPDVAISLYNLAALYDNQFRFLEAEPMFKAALAIFEDSLGPQHPCTQQVKNKVVLLCRLNQAMQTAVEKRAACTQDSDETV